jgi:hypothetical protein
MDHRAYNGFMGVDLDVKRREILGILTVGAAAAAVVEGQTPPSADGELQAARQGLQRDAQRIAMVNLPPGTEPAVHFHA